MDLAAAVDRLYAASPEDFVATRAALAAEAKGGGDRALAAEVRALRKPTLVGWAFNRLVRERVEVTARLGDLAARLRAAQAALDVDALRRLRPERDRLLDEVIGALGEVAAGHGRTLTAPATEEARQTLVAALADAEAERAVVSGRLLRALAYAGLGEVVVDEEMVSRPDLTLVPALPDETPDAASEGDAGPGDEVAALVPVDDAAERRRARRLAKARDAVDSAERELTAARLRQARAAQVLAQAQGALDEADRLLQRAEGELERRRREAADLA